MGFEPTHHQVKIESLVALSICILRHFVESDGVEPPESYDNAFTERPATPTV
jgi:hypothetical protein